MATKQTISFVGEADFGDVRAEVENTKKQISALRKEMAKSDKVTKSQADSMIALESKLKRLNGTLKPTANAADKASSKLEALKFAAQGAGGRTGELAGRAENLGRAFGLVSVGGAATAAGFVAVAAAFAGGAFAAFKLTEATIGLIQSSDELIDNTKAFRDLEGFGFGADDVDRVRSADAALDSLSTISSQLQLVMANTLAPTVERVATLIAAAGLAVLDSGEFFRDMGNAFLMPFEAQLRGIAKATILFKDLFGSPVSDALREAADGGDAVAVAFGLLDDNIADAERAAGSYLDRASELIGVQIGVNAAIRDGGKASKEAEQALKAQLKALETLSGISNKATTGQLSGFGKLKAARQEELAQVDALELQLAGFPGIEELATQARLAIHSKFNVDTQALADEETARRDKSRDDQLGKDKAAADKRLAFETKLAQSVQDVRAQSVAFAVDAIGSVTDEWLQASMAILDDQISTLESKEKLTQLEAHQLERLTRKRKAQAIAAFIVEKASALGAVGVNTAVAVMKAATAAPPPLNAPLISSMWVLGGLQAAAVLARPIPKFHTGGIIDQPAPGEQNITALQGEAVLNQQATRSLGRQGVAALNGGGGMDNGMLRAILEELQAIRRMAMRGGNNDGRRFAMAGTPGITRGFGGI